MSKTVHIDLIKSLCTGAEARGLKSSELLEQVGVSPKLLIQQNARFPAIKMAELTSLIKQQLQDESLGFLQHGLKPGSHEYSCRCSINSRNAREAYQHTTKLFDLATDDIKFYLIESGDEAEFQIHYPNPEKLDAIIFISLTILTVHRWINWLTGKKVLLNRLNVAFKRPSYADEYQNMFSCEHHFDQPISSMVFDRRFLDHPVIQTPNQLEQLLPKFPEDMISRFKLDNSISSQVQRMLQSGQEIDSLKFTQVAEQLHTSVDTLRRRLKEEGNSFAEIKESVRRSSASFWLANTDTAINSIALRLGFSEPSAFNRAFKKWTGQTPGEFRKKAQRPFTSQ